jgi:hypothetical protein
MRKILVESFIDKLRSSFGPAKTPIAEEPLRVLYDAKDYAGMIRHIQDILRLDMKVRLGLVNKGGPDAPAWVRRPEFMPHYGSLAFRQVTVEVYIRKSFLLESNFEQTVLAIAHELCHVVLDATGHSLRKQEEAVDLTAMLLGFRDFYVTGCRSEHKGSDVHRRAFSDFWEMYQVVNTGYLTLEEVSHAATYMTFR